MSDVYCPYCGKAQDINHDDGYGYEEEMKHQQECVSCGKSFVFTTSISFYYEVEKADCLNGEPHKLKKTATIPAEYAKMRCEVCGHTENIAPAASGKEGAK